jgi:hypothetical protein
MKRIWRLSIRMHPCDRALPSESRRLEPPGRDGHGPGASAVVVENVGMGGEVKDQRAEEP